MSQGARQPNLLSLPEDLFIDIGSWLNVRDVCSLELASKQFYDALSRPSRIGARQRRFALKLSSEMWPPLAQIFRWEFPIYMSAIMAVIAA